MRSPWRVVGLALPILGIGLPLATPGAAAHHATAALELVGQTFVLPAAGQLDVQLQLPASIAATAFTAADRVEIDSHPVIDDRATFLRQHDDGPTSTTDTVEVPLDPTVADPRAGVVDGVLRLGVATEATDATDEALFLRGAGVHPVTITLHAGRATLELHTYVYREPLDAEQAGDMSVGLLLGQTSQPQVGADGLVSVSSDQRAEYGRLADTLDAIQAAATDLALDPPSPAVAVEPSTARAVFDSDPALATRLAPTLAASELVAMPRLPFDPGAAAAAADTQHDTPGLYTSLLSQGEDLMGTVVPAARVDRSLWPADDQVSADGAILRRQLGTRLLVLPYALYDGLEGSTHDLVDTTQLLTVQLPDGTDLPAAVGDPHLEPQLDDAAEHPFATAVDVVADLLVMRREIELDAGLVDRHGILLSRSDHGVLDATFARDLVSLLLTTPGLQLVDPAELVTSVTRWVLDGLPVELQLPEHSSLDLRPRFELIDELSADVVSYGSMLPDDDPRFAVWSSTIDALTSTAVSDTAAADMAAILRTGFDAFHDAIEVDASSFTLTGRKSDVRFALRNLTDGPLKVRVSLSSPKIKFPEGDQIIELQPGVSTPVTFQAEALSNGTSSVFLRVYAPAENRDVQVTDERVLTARVNSFAGLGQLVTGAGLLLVLTWWVRHWRQSRRTRLAASNIDRHPSARGAVRTSATATATGELAPDAASSLPPS